jgi:ABC-type multidrug transport system fused ATPase/permease subunit
MSYVPQNPYLFGGTIRENLLLAKPDATDAELVDVCEKAHIINFIKSVPDGFDTWIGEHGLRLSGGERQRLAIARGLLKESPIYIFDELTANVDRETSLGIVSTIFDSRAEKTLLFISHEHDTLRHFKNKFDNTIVM